MHWFDGRLCEGSDITLAIDEPAFLYGATVFTTLRVYGSSLDHPLTCWAAHQDRLAQTLRAFSWSAPHWNRLRQGAESLSKEFPVLRLACFPDGRELVTGRSLPTGLEQMQRQGVSVWVADDALYTRSQPAYKTGNYLGSWLALQGAQRYGAREAILTNSQGHWLETSTGSLWGWAQGRWHTPELESGILAGVARLHLIRYLEQRGEPVSQAPWPAAASQRFEALAYSNSVVQLVLIHTVIGDRSRLELDPQHPALEGLRTAFQED
ncbi:MAG: aminotransferase class IV [Nodosilinea sp.]